MGQQRSRPCKLLVGLRHIQPGVWPRCSQLTWLLPAKPDRVCVERLLALALAMVRDFALCFGALVRARSANAFTPWLAEAGCNDMCGFAAGLRQDEQASTCSGRV